jgi:hypothetical protein
MMVAMTEENWTTPRWMDPSQLLTLVQRDVSIRGRELPGDAIMREPLLLIPVSAPENPPLDMNTYEVRLARWNEGEGPQLAGMETFVSVMRSLAAPACVVSVRGALTTYCFLLDAALTKVLATVAIDPRD